MSQLSRPYQIALGALLVFALAWFTVLKPSAAAEPAAPAASAPGAAGLGRAVDSAQDAAAAAAPATPAPAPGAAPAPAAPPAPSPPATGGAPTAEPAAPRKDPSAPILRDVARGRVAVVLFFSREASDDRAVRRALLAADRHGGKVVVRAAPISRVADYAAITQGVDVTQAPTLLVIGRDNRARQIVGFTDTRGIDQLVADVGGASFLPRRVTGFRGRVENLCAVVGQSVVGDALNGADLADRLGIVRADLIDARRALRRLRAPERYDAFRRAFEANLDAGIAAFGAALRAEKAGQDPLRVFATYMDRIASTDAKLESAARRAGLAKGC